MKPTSKKSNWKRRGATAAVAVGLAGGAVGASATVAGAATSSEATTGAHGSMAPGGSGGPPGKGDHLAMMPEKVTAVGASTITVESHQDKTQTVSITSTTKFLDGKKAVSLSSVKVGDYITVTSAGSSKANSTANVTATTVTIVPAGANGFGKGGPMSGGKGGPRSNGKMGSPPSGSGS